MQPACRQAVIQDVQDAGWASLSNPYPVSCIPYPPSFNPHRDSAQSYHQQLSGDSKKSSSDI